ncbi:hypothetical protein ASF41_02890 [Methylobacterium sp. Leaf111]|uniref:hypothetical protein n=1 Tax=Methylobacterium sp. Leaf111 TaxID=1736257 RepID=UPI00072BF506|nr:hypothetical protein [Methylobacterium sp. Leaf111]KQP76724.1 hypothetical protein ASF41_02890 [Methylobacterium sp. Leaf111]
MADTEHRDENGRVAGQPGYKRPVPGIEGPVLTGKANDTLSTVAGQAKETLRSVSDRAPEMVDDLSRRGANYYRHGRRAVSNADTTTVASMFIAGTIGFGIGWLVFGQKSYSGDYVARRMSDSSDRRY